MPRSLLLRIMLAAVAVTAACASGLFGVASFLFQRGDRHSVELAARLVPLNATYLARLSGFDAEKRTQVLQKAAALNPYAEQTWLQLGLDAEFHHADYSLAEKYYLQAATVSHLYLPRWTLTNFYFRRGNEQAFVQWARSALQITPYKADPIFTELWLANPEGHQVSMAIPDRPEILDQYLMFLMNASQFASVPPVLERLVRAVPPSEAGPYGLTYAIGPSLDRLLASGYLAEALRMWQTLSTAKWIPFPTPNPDQPLTNGGFAGLFGHGFDWVLANNSGISLTPPGAAREIGIELSGDQPESCMVLQQWMPIGGGRRYRIRWKAEPSGLSGNAGLTWHLRGPNLNLQSPDLLTRDGATWTFQTPPGVHLAVLTLEYQRALGETKANGNLALQNVSLQPG